MASALPTFAHTHGLSHFLMQDSEGETVDSILDVGVDPSLVEQLAVQ